MVIETLYLLWSVAQIQNKLIEKRYRPRQNIQKAYFGYGQQPVLDLKLIPDNGEMALP